MADNFEGIKNRRFGIEIMYAKIKLSHFSAK